MAKYIMALDAGTTSNRCILFNEQGEMCSVAQKEFTQYFPQPGWVEHDANEIWSTQIEVAQRGYGEHRGDRRRHCRHRHHQPAGDHHRLGQKNRRAGVPRHRLAVPPHQCVLRRAEGDRADGAIPGARPVWSSTPIFPAPSCSWILENVPGVRERAERGELLFGTVETWLIWKLTGGKAHVTDYSNASRTMLFNINTLRWDDEILTELDIPKCMLPEVRPCSCIYGEAHGAVFWRRPSPSRGRRETSRRRCSVRPASSPGRPKTPTAPAALC